MRVPLLSLTGRAAYSPIETIVTFFVVGTLAYFRILSAIKHSAFFAPAFPSFLPTHALLRDGQWIVVDEGWYMRSPAQKIELQQLLFSNAKAVDPVRSLSCT